MLIVYEMYGGNILITTQKLEKETIKLENIDVANQTIDGERYNRKVISSSCVLLTSVLEWL